MAAGLITAGIGLVQTLAREWMEGRQQAAAAKREVKAAAASARAAKMKHASEWERRVLEGQDKWLRRGSFLLWSAPMLWAAIDPEGAAGYFAEALAALPPWYVSGYMAVTGAIWGLSEFKSWRVRQ